MTGKQTIEKALQEVVNSSPFSLGLTGMSIDECYGYKEGLITAYLHALEVMEVEEYK